MTCNVLLFAVTSVILTACQGDSEVTVDIGLFPVSVIPVLSNEAFQKEIHLTDQQRKQLDALLACHLDARRRLQSPESANLAAEERRALMDAARERISAKGLRAILDEQQFGRAQQILLRSLGYKLFYQPEVVTALQLSGDQRTRIREIFRETLRAIQGDAAMTPDGPRIRTPDDADVRKQLWDQMTEVLNEEQHRTLTRVLGEPFCVDDLDSVRIP